MTNPKTYYECYASCRTDENGNFKVPMSWMLEIQKFFPDSHIELIARKKRSHRSIEQNRLIHKIFRIFSAELVDYTGDRMYTPELIKELMKQKFLKYEVVSEVSGEVLGEAVKPTSSLNKSELSDFVENIINYAYENFKIKLPRPGEQINAEL